MKVHYKKNELSLIVNEKAVQSPGPIWQVFVHEYLVIVTLHPDWDLQNVFCLNKKGEQIWRIEKPGFFTAAKQGYDYVVYDDSLDETEFIAGRILAYNRGRPFELDIKTGKVTTIPGNFEK